MCSAVADWISIVEVSAEFSGGNASVSGPELFPGVLIGWLSERSLDSSRVGMLRDQECGQFLVR